jgi:hypothetical protein
MSLAALGIRKFTKAFSHSMRVSRISADAVERAFATNGLTPGWIGDGARVVSPSGEVAIGARSGVILSLPQRYACCAGATPWAMMRQA